MLIHCHDCASKSGWACDCEEIALAITAPVSVGRAAFEAYQERITLAREQMRRDIPFALAPRLPPHTWDELPIIVRASWESLARRQEAPR